MRFRLLAEESQEQLDAIISTSKPAKESNFEDLPVADNARESLGQSQDTVTLLADEDDLEVPRVQGKTVLDAEDEPTWISEGAEELENINSSDEDVVDPVTIVEEAIQETDTTKLTAPHVEESTSNIAPKTHVEQEGDFNGETESSGPEAAVAAGAIGLVGVGALGLANVVRDDDDEEEEEDKTLVKASSDNADVDEAITITNPEVWWASSKENSKDPVGPVKETEPEEEEELVFTPSLEEEHAAISPEDDEFLARDVVSEAAQVELSFSEEVEPKETDALAPPVVEELEQTSLAHDNVLVKDVEETAEIAGSQTPNDVEAEEDEVKADVMSGNHPTVTVPDTETALDGTTTVEHKGVEEDLPAAMEISTEEREVVFPEINVEELPVVQDHDSAFDTKEVVNEEESLVSEEPLDEEGTSHLPFTSPLVPETNKPY